MMEVTPKHVAFFFIGTFAFIGGLLYGGPQYGVYKQRLEGEAMLAHSQSAKEVAVSEAKAKMEAARLLSAGKPEVMDALGKQFESALIKTALKHTHGRKNDAAIRLGIGRNTITRKIQELGIEGGKDD